jgi:hypothetical protein
VKRTVLAALALFGAGCGPTGPSSVTEGTIVFEGTNFSGSFRPITVDVADLEDVNPGCQGYPYTSIDPGDWGDCISSIRIAPGWTATIYNDDHYRGQSLTITSDTPNLESVQGPCGGDWNDCVSSIRVSRQ